MIRIKTNKDKHIYIGNAEIKVNDIKMILDNSGKHYLSSKIKLFLSSNSIGNDDWSDLVKHHKIPEVEITLNGEKFLFKNVSGNYFFSSIKLKEAHLFNAL